MKRTIIITLAGLAAIVALQDFLQSKKKAQPVAPRPYVVMLSLDGFRWDYQGKAPTPTLDSITRYGVKARGLQPSFPSKTFPNHYSIATGMYPGNHGIVSNTFYDPKQKKEYSISDRAAVGNGKFYKGEPIWVTAEAQRIKSGSFFWVGSEAKIKGYRPTYWKPYKHNFPYLQRADSVIEWLKKPYNERPKLITWYISKSDDVGHKYGPDSPETKNTIMQLDSILGYFMQRLNRLEIKDSVNFIIVSDHGMAAIDTQKVVPLYKYINPVWVNKIYGGNPFLMINPKKQYLDSIINNLAGVKGVAAWEGDNIPERFHLRQSNRVAEIVVVADTGWCIQPDSGMVFRGGTHGYDNTMRDMQGVFYGIGPNFKSGYNAGTLYNIDIYNLIAHILQIKPAPNDGRRERIFMVLKQED